MESAFAANTELSRRFSASISYFPAKTILHNCPRRIASLSVATGRVKNNCRVLSMSGNGSSSGGGLTYKDAGVDIDAGSELVKRIAKMAPGIGGFGGLFPLGDSFLFAGTDGVGTKLKLAFETGIHDTIGIDLVAMSVNDIVTSGAKPLFFLAYFATSHLDVDLAEKVIKGIVDGCQQSDCALLGGETAEMPDFYAEGEYMILVVLRLALLKRNQLLMGKTLLPEMNSLACHLVESIPMVSLLVLAQSGLSLKDQLPGGNCTVGEALMAPTVIYVKQVLDIISKGVSRTIYHECSQRALVLSYMRTLGKFQLYSNGSNK